MSNMQIISFPYFQLIIIAINHGEISVVLRKKTTI